MNEIAKETESEEQQSKSNDNVYKGSVFWVRNSYETDIAVKMLGDRIHNNGNPGNQGKDNNNNMERIQDHIPNVKTISDHTHSDGKKNKADNWDTHYNTTQV